MHHQYGISALVSQMPFRGETTGGIMICQLFSQDQSQANTIMACLKIK